MSKPLSEMTLEELWELFPIILTEHKDEWDKFYGEEYALLSKVLENKNIIRISHIGSTAIHGIWAKPTVDILVEIPRDCDRNELKEILVHNAGYGCMLENEEQICMNKGYTENGFAEKVFHLHMRYQGDHDELYFRDYMNEHPELAKEYETLKLSLWKTYEHNRDGYTEAKSNFVKKYTKEAKEAYANRYEEYTC